LFYLLQCCKGILNFLTSPFSLFCSCGFAFFYWKSLKYLYLYINFIEVQFTYNSIHLFWVFKLINFGRYTEVYHYQYSHDTDKEQS
jgi:hypothetical protein